MASKAVEDIKQKLSIVDVISPYVKLKKAGRYMKGLSPFTNEKSASFFVSPDRGTYYCFSSNQGGDIFTFVEKMEGVDFKGALKILAEKAGVQLQYEAPEKRDARDSLYQALSLAEQFYRQQLQGNEEAKKYAKSRGITGETARAWGLGYAPDDWRALLTHAEGRGITIPTLLNAGLIKESENKKGTYYDRFRHRLMFPIRDIAGRVIGFSGRALSKDEDAKYLNSPETEVFKKSEMLYGLDMAKQDIRTRGYVLVVEGQMDLVLAHQAGFTNTIALSGTAFTETQLGLVNRFTKNMMLALDNDRAGIASAEKSALLALSRGCKVKVVPMPEGKDPADVITEDPKVFGEMVKKSAHVIDFLTLHYLQSVPDTRKALALVESHVLPLVKALPSPIEREHFVGEVSGMLGISGAAVQEALSTIDVESVDTSAILETVPHEADTVPDSFARRIIALSALLELYPNYSKRKELEATLTKLGGAKEVPERVRFELEELYGEEPKEEDIEWFRIESEKEFAKRELALATKALRIAERENDEKRINELTETIQKLTNTLREYK